MLSGTELRNSLTPFWVAAVIQLLSPSDCIISDITLTLTDNDETRHTTQMRPRKHVGARLFSTQLARCISGNVCRKRKAARPSGQGRAYLSGMSTEADAASQIQAGNQPKMVRSWFGQLKLLLDL